MVEGSNFLAAVLIYASEYIILLDFSTANKMSCFWTPMEPKIPTENGPCTNAVTILWHGNVATSVIHILKALNARAQLSNKTCLPAATPLYFLLLLTCCDCSYTIKTTIDSTRTRKFCSCMKIQASERDQLTYGICSRIDEKHRDSRKIADFRGRTLSGSFTTRYLYGHRLLVRLGYCNKSELWFIFWLLTTRRRFLKSKPIVNTDRMSWYSRLSGYVFIWRHDLISFFIRSFYNMMH